MSGDDLRLSPARIGAFGNADKLYGTPEQRRLALADDMGLHNVLGYEAAFADQSVGVDFLRPESPYHHLKTLATEVYGDVFDPHLNTVPDDAAALDAGCGIGRFTLSLAERFATVTAFDPCRAALNCAARHVAKSGRDNINLLHGDLAGLTDLPAATFDVVFAVELFCYTAAPERAALQLFRLARPGALLFASVEALPGALSGVSLPGPDAVTAALAGEPMLVPGDRYVRYFDRAALAELVTQAGFEIIEVFDAHFFAEGPLWQALDENRLADPAYRLQIREAERACRADLRLHNFARATGVVARKA